VLNDEIEKKSIKNWYKKQLESNRVNSLSIILRSLDQNNIIENK
jgi:hypothetical protein